MIAKFTEEFFNLDVPCPKEIYMCEQLRVKYQEEIQNKQSHGCKKCELTGIKARYMQIIWKRYMDDLINSKKKQDILL